MKKLKEATNNKIFKVYKYEINANIKILKACKSGIISKEGLYLSKEKYPSDSLSLPNKWYAHYQEKSTREEEE
jgi:hypothetical protein